MEGLQCPVEGDRALYLDLNPIRSGNTFLRGKQMLEVDRSAAAQELDSTTSWAEKQDV